MAIHENPRVSGCAFVDCFAAPRLAMTVFYQETSALLVFGEASELREAVGDIPLFVAVRNLALGIPGFVVFEPVGEHPWNHEAHKRDIENALLSLGCVGAIVTTEFFIQCRG